MRDRDIKQFEVTPGRAVNLHAVGLVDGEKIILQYTVHKGCKPKNAEFADYYENAKLVVLDTEHNPLTLWRPGWYRLVPEIEVTRGVQIVLSDSFAVDIVALINNVAIP